jgi:hypothetical protein
LPDPYVTENQLLSSAAGRAVQSPTIVWLGALVGGVLDGVLVGALDSAVDGTVVIELS